MGGIKAYSDVTQRVTTVVNSTENLIGVAWDPVHRQLYYSGPYVIYRTGIDGAHVQTVLNTTDCKLSPTW